MKTEVAESEIHQLKVSSLVWLTHLLFGAALTIVVFIWGTDDSDSSPGYLVCFFALILLLIVYGFTAFTMTARATRKRQELEKQREIHLGNRQSKHPGKYSS